MLREPRPRLAWFGDGYWESTRGLKNGARDGFAHFVIVGSVAPRQVIYAHEFAWDAKTDPAWPRLQKIFGFYGAKDKLASVHGKGKVTGPAGPDNTHCTHIGAVHRKMIYPALKDWFGMPIPEEYSKRRPAEELMCWTDGGAEGTEAEEVARSRSANIAGGESRIAAGRRASLSTEAGTTRWTASEWAKLLGNVEPAANPKLTGGKAEDSARRARSRLALEVEPGIVVPAVARHPEGREGESSGRRDGGAGRQGGVPEGTRRRDRGVPEGGRRGVPAGRAGHRRNAAGDSAEPRQFAAPRSRRRT